MDLYLIRHGDAGSIPGGYVGGSDDPPLTPRGRTQCTYLAERLAGMNLDALYCGALLRNLETAEFISDRTGLKPVLIPGLFEIEGNLAAWTVENACARFPMVADALPWPVCQRERKETREEACERARTVSDWLVAQYSAREIRIGVVAHGNFMGLMVEYLLRMEPRDYNRFSAGNCCLHWLEITPERIKLRASNDQEHIPLAERT
jgi:broad specificity phosphatase PhoE